ncbi:Phosphate-specific transport system accessory protein PhoU [Pseudoalteromonas haloplanktis]|uniref:Phosphate-specific transport system accessory protein PhoU n=2 Tax=Gammaproteobacteria TaxID=1236 RepID=A0A9W4QXT3_PSEHA|nr:phosphate signaling complex protein PhoU [Pseudoalteromonas haloplanktis]CAH9057621.1 Phosphate-specific transport system accessory protein PhoU [Pseudoalteromonas haloplanktis]
MEHNINKHISGRFNQELEDVRNHVLSMGGLVEQQLNSALDAVSKNDAVLAQKVRENDYKVNAMEVSIDEDCTRIIAKRQPAASDLRLVIAIAKTIADLERIGDEAKRIAKVALDSFTKDQQDLLVNIENMGRQVSKMLHDVLDAFARMDVQRAFEVHKEDAKVDREYEAITRQIMTYMMEDPRSIPKIMDLVWSVRSLERIGDRCQNIAEYVIYFVNGKDIRHTSQEDIEKITVVIRITRK